jgi:hypothetical protein
MEAAPMEDYRKPMTVLSYLLLMVSATAVGRGQARTPEPKLNHKELRALILHATTPADHERLAQYYQREARRLMAQAKEHEQLARAYGDRTSLGDPNGFNIGRAARHCHIVARECLKEATALATIHERMAKEAAKKNQ